MISIQFSRPRSEQPGISGINPQSAFLLYFPANERDRRFEGDEARKNKNKGRTSVRRARGRTRASAALQGSVFFKCHSKLMNQSPRRAQVRCQFSPPPISLFLARFENPKSRKFPVTSPRRRVKRAQQKFCWVFFFQLKRRFLGLISDNKKPLLFSSLFSLSLKSAVVHYESR